MNQEKVKPTAYPNYGITRDGIVFNYRLSVPMALKIVNQWKAVVISFKKKPKLVYVHDLIADAFLPPRPATAQCYIGRDNETVHPDYEGVPWLLSYKDGDPSSAHADKLEWRLAGACSCQVWMATLPKRPPVSELPRRVIARYPLYEIDTDGTVYRVGRDSLVPIKTFTEDTRGRGERNRYEVRIPRVYVMLRPTLDGEGLKPVKCYVVQLLGSTFLGPLPDQHIYWFKDCDPGHCVLENLCIIDGPLSIQIYQKAWLDKTHYWTLEDGFTEVPAKEKFKNLRPADKVSDSMMNPSIISEVQRRM